MRMENGVEIVSVKAEPHPDEDDVFLLTTKLLVRANNSIEAIGWYVGVVDQG